MQTLGSMKKYPPLVFNTTMPNQLLVQIILGLTLDAELDFHERIDNKIS